MSRIAACQPVKSVRLTVGYRIAAPVRGLPSRPRWLLHHRGVRAYALCELGNDEGDGGCRRACEKSWCTGGHPGGCSWCGTSAPCSATPRLEIERLRELDNYGHRCVTRRAPRVATPTRLTALPTRSR